MEDKKTQISAHFISLSKQFASPEIKIDDSDKYVKNGSDNKYPYYLQELYRTSGLHRSIIERKANMIYGKGLNLEGKEDELLMGNRFETLNDVFKKATYDYETFGGYYLQIIWEKGGKKIAEVYHMPYERMRNGLKNKYGYVDKYYYWSDETEKISSWTNLSDFTEFGAFSMTGNKSKPQILAVNAYSPANSYYGEPIYAGAVLDVQTYAEISNYHNSNLHNNFSPGYSIFFRGPEPDPEQKDAIVKTLKDKYSGSENTGKPMVFFLDTEQEAPLIEPIDSSNVGEQFKTLVDTIKDNIVISHQIPRQVVGLESAGSLGNSKEILQASAMFKSDYIIPHQDSILTGFNMISQINYKNTLSVINPTPSILAFDMSELLTILSKNEVRELLGYEIVEDDVMEEIDEEDVENNEIIKDEDND